MPRFTNVEEEINEFLEDLRNKAIYAFVQDMYPLFDLYNVDKDDDWAEKIVGKEDMHNVRLIRTVYLMSKIAELHAGKLAMLSCKYPKLWKRLEKMVEKIEMLENPT